MKRFLARVLFFFLLVAIVDKGIGLIGDYLQWTTKGGDARWLNDLLMKDEHDILFLGSSRCRDHYDTPFISDTLKMRAYNAGLPGNGVVLARCILEKSLERYHPKCVVLDVTPYVDLFTNGGSEDYSRYTSILKPYFRDSEIADIMKSVSLAEWYKAHSGMVRYNTVLAPMLLYALRDPGMDPYGFTATVGTIVDDPPKGDTTAQSFDAVKYEQILKIIQMSKASAVPLFIAVSPEYNFHYSFSLDSLVSVCERYDVPLLNHYADPDINMHKEWFRDPNHLNGAGARVYSRKIAEEIKDAVTEFENSL